MVSNITYSREIFEREMKREILRAEQQKIQIQLNQLKKVSQSIVKLNRDTQFLKKGKDLVGLYRHLRELGANKLATEMLTHTENVIRELNELINNLKESEAILIRQAQHYEQKSKASS